MRRTQLTLVGDLIIETKRLLLKPPEKEDVDGPICRWLRTDVQAIEYLDREGNALFEQATEHKRSSPVVLLRKLPYITRPRAPSDNRKPVKWIAFSIFIKEDTRTPIGFAVLYDIHLAHGFQSLRVFIERKHRRTGFGKEGTAALMEFAFEEMLDLDGDPWYSVEAWWVRPNAPSAHTFPSCGFRILGDVLEGRIKIRGRRHDMIMSEFTRPTWEAMKKKLGNDFFPAAPRWQLPGINRHLDIAGILKFLEPEIHKPRELLSSFRYKIVRKV